MSQSDSVTARSRRSEEEGGSKDEEEQSDGIAEMSLHYAAKSELNGVLSAAAAANHHDDP